MVKGSSEAYNPTLIFKNTEWDVTCQRNLMCTLRERMWKNEEDDIFLMNWMNIENRYTTYLYVLQLNKLVMPHQHHLLTL